MNLNIKGIINGLAGSTALVEKNGKIWNTDSGLFDGKPIFLNSAPPANGTTVAELMETKINNLVIANYIEKSKLSDFFEVIGGVRDNQQIPIVKGFGQRYGGKGVSPDFSFDGTGMLEFADKVFRPVPISEQTPIIPDQFSQIFAIWYSKNNSLYDTNESALTVFISAFVIDATAKMYFRLAVNGDKSYVPLTGNPNYRTGDENFITPIDGFVKQLVASDCPKVTIARNAQPTKDLQQYQGSDYIGQVVLRTWEDMIRAQKTELRTVKAEDKMMFVDPASFDEALAEMAIKGDDKIGGYRYNEAEDTIYRGKLAIKPLYNYQEVIETFFETTDGANPSFTRWVNPHIAVLFKKDMAQVGIESKDKSPSLETGVNKDNYPTIFMKTKFDAVFAVTNLAVLAI